MRIVVALGGNALLRRTDPPEAELQQEHVRAAAAAIAPVADKHQVIICHGNGPQIGMLAMESADDPRLTRPFPLDALGAQTQGMIGYWLAQELANAGVLRPIAVVVTQTVVDADDPAFDKPTKFVGRTYSSGEAHRLAAKRGWTVAPDGNRWRRTVPSPQPKRIVEIPVISGLVEQGTIVVCGGGGGAPVVQDDTGLHGVEAVVDKDFTAAVLAAEVGADRLVLLTDVDSVKRNFGTPEQSSLLSVNTAELRKMLFPAGSMGPKVEACVQFVEQTGNVAVIGSLAQAAKVIDGSAGTTVTRAPDPAAPAARERSDAPSTTES
jgi:carbamate kinase